MEGQKIIKPVTGVLVFEPKGNEIIERLNVPWEMKVDPEGVVTTATVKYGDNKITISLEFNTETFVVCDDSGNQRTITALAYQPGEVE